MRKRNVDDRPDDNINGPPLMSVRDRRCLSRCYPAGEVYFHPVVLTGLRDPSISTCAIQPIPDKELFYPTNQEMIYIDKCDLNDNKTHAIPNEIESILLSFSFSAREFLYSVYNLKTFDEVIYWTLENDYLPYDTLKRVHNCAWKVFGASLENISSIVLHYYWDISTHKWIKQYAAALMKTHSFDIVTSDEESEESNVSDRARLEKILGKTMTYSFFTASVHSYILGHADDWKLIESPYDELKKWIYLQLIEVLEGK